MQMTTPQRDTLASVNQPVPYKVVKVLVVCTFMTVSFAQR
jgi:hypothetical protein